MIRMYARSFLWGREMWVREYKKSVKWPSTAFSLFLMSCPNNTRSLLAHTYQISAEYIAIWQIANLIVLKKSIAEYSSIIDMSMCHHYSYTYVYDLALSYLWICYYSLYHWRNELYWKGRRSIYQSTFSFFYLYLIAYAKLYLTG
jgi:hypothetical protein